MGREIEFGELMNILNDSTPGSRDTVTAMPTTGSPPPLGAMTDLLSWWPTRFAPLAWREAFDVQLERRASAMFAKFGPDDCLAEALGLLPTTSRQRFLRAPAVATILRRGVNDQFDSRRFAELLLAELAAAGVVAELPESGWTPRGDRFLDRSAPERWRLPGAVLSYTSIDLDEESLFKFPDDEFGTAATVPHVTQEREVVKGRVLTAIAEMRQACALALDLVTTIIEVLALRREPTNATAFYSSTFCSYPGLVRFTNTHLPYADTAAIMEALVHEAIHCILHVHEEIEGAFLLTAEADQRTVVSPWTGATIHLQSYIHACAVWYGIYWLWSREGFGSGIPRWRVEMLRTRAQRGFQHHPVRAGLMPFSNFLTESIKDLLQELEGRMLSLT
jgi:hypothetical protein